jgi:ABC-2 type transport system permease protein
MPIFDQGYQHWQGPLSGRVWRWITIARHGVRVQRNNRILRILLLLAWLPALVLVGVMVLWGLVERQSESVLMFLRGLPPDLLQQPQAFRATVWTLAYSLFFKVEMYFILLLVTIAGPGLISQDLRFNALPLYFARPLTRLDYFLGKLGVIGALVASVAVGPALFAYVVGVCFCLDLSVVKDTYLILLASVAYGLVITLSAGTLILALSSLTRRTLYVGITWAGLWIISASVAAILTAIHGESVHRQIWITEQNHWLDEHPPPSGAQISGTGNWRYPVLRENPKTRKYQLAGLRPDQEKEGERWLNAWTKAQFHAWERARAKQGAMMRGDWRPMCSYVANLERIADLLLDTENAWVRIGSSVERERRAALEKRFGGASFRGGPTSEIPEGNEHEMADHFVLQYPWWWSAAVLAGLLGVSTWILTRRVKSLDRLK